MYGIPNDFDISNIIGKKIEGILLDPNILHLNFSDKWFIHCSGKIEVIIDNKQYVIKEKEIYKDLNSIISIFNSNVSTWKIIDSKSFCIIFENKVVLKLTDDSDIYGSFQIYPEGWII
jgi:hypothetical protein